MLDTVDYINAFSVAEHMLLGEASPPPPPGVYGFLYQGALRYIGEAKGRGGLADRIKSKHLAGDEGHALQRAFQTAYPNRLARRNFLKRSIRVKWIVAELPDRVGEIEKRLIRLHRPEWNRR